jgi:hypothetical protein
MSSKDVMMYSNLKDWLELYETLWEINPIMNNVRSYFTKTIYFLYKSYGQKYVATPIFIFFWTKFGYYYNYYVIIWRNKTWIWSKSSVTRKLQMSGTGRIAQVQKRPRAPFQFLHPLALCPQTLGHFFPPPPPSQPPLSTTTAASEPVTRSHHASHHNQHQAE